MQHPLEVSNAKGSARLMCLSLRHSRLVTGEQFAEPTLHALLGSLPLASDTGRHPRHTLLLYPPTTKDAAGDETAPPVPAPATWVDPGQLRLIVLDGTWRQSRKLLSLNPLLQQLPRLALRQTPASRYLIRKAHRPDQLSTLEATCAALMQLEGRAEPFQTLLNAFDGFVAQQIRQAAQARAARA